MNEEILEVKIKKKEINFIIWLIPIVSLIVGGWLIYKYYSSLGPLITIQFKNSGGLEPKRSVVKFREVAVGKVEKVEIIKNGDGVKVYVRMHKEMKPFLNKTTKFWIVKPQIGLEQIKGLDALLSGPYIQMYAKPEGYTKEHFIGLNEPPIDSSILNGKIIDLIADSTYGLSARLPVYYKHLKVGTIRKVELMKNRKVKITVSINRQYEFLINNSTKFWNLKEINLFFNKNYLQVSLPTLKEMLFGGIEFDTPDVNERLTKKIFKLYPSKADAFANKLGDYINYKEFIVKFDKENSLIEPGEPVKFKGFDVGFVKDVKSYFDIDKNQIYSYAILKINIGAFDSNHNKDIIKKLFQKGMMVYINNSLPFINNASINIEFTNKSYNYEIKNGKVVLKAFYKKEHSLIDKINQFLDKLNSLQIEETVKDLNNFIKKTTPTLNKTLISITNTSDALKNSIDNNNKKISDLLINLNNLIINLNSTVKSYSNNSIFYKQISKTLYDVDKTMNNLNRVIIKIDKKPNSLILGD